MVASLNSYHFVLNSYRFWNEYSSFSYCKEELSHNLGLRATRLPWKMPVHLQFETVRCSTKSQASAWHEPQECRVARKGGCFQMFICTETIRTHWSSKSWPNICVPLRTAVACSRVRALCSMDKEVWMIQIRFSLHRKGEAERLYFMFRFRFCKKYKPDECI